MPNAQVLTKIFGMVAVDFCVKTIPPVLLLCIPCQKRGNFPVRAAFSAVFLLLYTAFLSYVYMMIHHGGALNYTLYVLFLLLLVGVFLVQLFLYSSSALVLLLNLLGGFALYQICLFLFYILSYQIPALNSMPGDSFVYYLIMAIWFSIAYSVSYFLFIKKQNAGFDDSIEGMQTTLLLSVGMSLFLIEFNLVRNRNIEHQSITDYMCLVCLILFYLLILLFRGGLLKNLASEKELMLTKRVWEEKEKSLKLTQEAVNTINIKYHDLKHMTSKLRQGENALDLVSDITDSLKAYENTVSTGNDTLDMILTEQMLKYNQNGIEFSCMADGSAISFMSSLDIISLFSNALDNAYEAVTALDKGHRDIYLNVRKTMGMVSITVENPYSSRITLQNGLPVTIKADKEYHGFGMKSIRSTVEKYGGDVQILTEDNRFRLKILIPA